MILRKKIQFNAWLIISALALVFTFNSCRDDQFDEPPITGEDPGLSVNMTLDSLKTIYKSQLTNYSSIPYIKIDNDWTIKATVIGDDKSGNLYKTMVVDDGTAGIAIKLDLSNFYTDYPVGREVYVKLKGLTLSYYGGLVQIGGFKDTVNATPSLASIPASLVRNYIIGGKWGNTVTPFTVNFADLGADGKSAASYKWQSRLIKIEKVQFQSGDAGQVWANQPALGSVNRYLECCYSFPSSIGGIIVRTSGYSDFANDLTPTNSGSIIGIYSVYSTDKQLTLRDPSDCLMDTARFTSGACGSAPVPPPPAATLTTIANIRSQYTGSSTTVNGSYKITGVVISDATFQNLNSQNVVIQDATGGIVVRFDATHSFAIGDSIVVNVTGQSLSEYNGLLQVGGTSPSVPIAYGTKVGTGTITPRVVTAADLIANMIGTQSWESTLIKINNVTFSTATFTTSTNVVDATGTVLLYTDCTGTFQATFANAAIPAGTSVTAIVSEFNGLQLNVRSPSDVN
ncbi:MAG: DUF5689 domain-containing protein [Bacteroidota bacterium]|jgi:hypothetical protein